MTMQVVVVCWLLLLPVVSETERNRTALVIRILSELKMIMVLAGEHFRKHWLAGKQKKPCWHVDSPILRQK